MLSLRHLGLTVLAMLVMAGCSGSPRTDFYTLSPVAAAATGPKLGLAIVIGPTDLPREIQRSQIITRTSPNKVKVNEFERWAGSLAFDFDRTIADNLERTLPSERVVAYPAQPRIAIDYRVLLEIRQFDGTPGESVSLRGAWTIVSGNDELIAVQKFDINEATDGSGFEALVAAHSAALGQLSASIKAGLLGAKTSADIPGG